MLNYNKSYMLELLTLYGNNPGKALKITPKCKNWDEVWILDLYGIIGHYGYPNMEWHKTGEWFRLTKIGIGFLNDLGNNPNFGKGNAEVDKHLLACELSLFIGKHKDG